MIEAGANWTTSAAVELTSDVSGATEMRFSNTDGDWPSWEAYDVAKSWTLSSGDGLKTVYAQYRDAAGNRLDVQDSITLDSHAPATSLAARDSIWQNTVACLNLSATDSVRVLRIMAAVDGSAQVPAYGNSMSVTVDAPSDHSNDGLHVVTYWAEDAAGNVEPAHATSVGIDTRRPASKMTARALVRRGAVAKLAYRVADTAPNGGSADVVISIISREGKTVKKATVAGATVNKSLRFTFRCRLKKGTYKVRISATDAAGNAQAKAGWGGLTVK